MAQSKRWERPERPVFVARWTSLSWLLLPHGSSPRPPTCLGPRQGSPHHGAVEGLPLCLPLPVSSRRGRAGKAGLTGDSTAQGKSVWSPRKPRKGRSSYTELWKHFHPFLNGCPLGASGTGGGDTMGMHTDMTLATAAGSRVRSPWPWAVMEVQEPARAVGEDWTQGSTRATVSC